MKIITRLGCAFLLIAIASTVAFSQQTEETARNYYKLGLVDLERRKYDSAIEFFTIAIGVKADLVDAYLARSKAQQYKGEFKAAFLDAQKIIKIDPKFGEAYFRSGKLRGFLIKKKLSDDSETAIGEVVQVSKQILEDYDKSVGNGYKTAEVYLARAAHKCELMNMCREAIADYDLALALNPGESEILQRRAIAKYKSGDKQGATADYLKIENKSDLDPRKPGIVNKTIRDFNDSPNIAEEIADAIAHAFAKPTRRLMDEGKTKEVIAELTKGINLFPENYQLFASRAHYARFAKNKETLESDALRMIDLKPFDFETQRTALHYLMGIRKCDLSIEIMNRALVENPKNPEAFLWRGNAKSCLEDFEGALADNDIAISIEPANENFKANRANILARQKKTIKSLDTYTEVINALELVLSTSKDESELAKTRRDISYAYIARSRIFSSLNKVDEAFYDLDRAIQILPEFYAYQTRAGVYRWQKRFEESIRDLNEMLKMQPNALGVYIERGDVYFHMGNYTEALADYLKASELKGEIRKMVDEKIRLTKEKLGVK